MLAKTAEEAIANLGSAPDLSGDNLQRDAAYMRGEQNALFSGWNPPVRRLEYDVRQGWQKAAARATDVMQNQGFIAGAIEQAAALVVGNGLRGRYLPHFASLGMKEDAESRAWAKDVMTKFMLWADNPTEFDAEGRLTFGQMQAAAYKHWFATGEIFATVPYYRSFGMKYGTRVKLLPATRIYNHNLEHENVVHGVRLNTMGAAQSFFISEGRFDKVGQLPREYQKFDAYGRSLILHIFDGLPGQIRGISPLAPVLRVLKQFDRLSDATMTAATIASVFAATIESDEPTEAILRSLQTPAEQAKANKSQMDSYFTAIGGFGTQKAQINLDDNGRIIQMFPGRKLIFNESKQQNTNYETFATHLLLEIARVMGLSYQSTTGDYKGSTYNSNISTITDIHAVTLNRRYSLLKPFCQQVFSAWLEEAVEIGEVVFPGGYEGFLLNKSAACRSDWLGTGKPTADDLKRAKTLQIYKMLGVYSDEQIANDLGMDIEEVYASRARCEELRIEYGLDLYDQPFTQLSLADEKDTSDGEEE